MNSLTRFVRQYIAILVLLVTIAFLGLATGGDVDKMTTRVDGAFGGIVEFMATGYFFLETDGWRFGIPGLFWEIPFLKIPLVVLVLIGGAIFFTLRFSFINVRGFRHAIDIVRGRFDDPNDPGEVSHFQALSSALSATVGLGNIAGVAIAVSVGGPGAVFWMMFAAFFGMVSKFAECTLGQMYRQVDSNGNVRGGPMVYLQEGLSERGFPKFGRVLSVIFAVLCIGGSFGGGNMFQANQSFEAMTTLIPALGGEKATATIRIVADQPEDLELRRHLVKFVRPGDEQSETSTLVFHPLADLSVRRDQWEPAVGGGYQLEFEAVAARAGTGYNVDRGTVTQLSIGTIEGKQVAWRTPPNWSVTNTERFRGGTGHLGWLYGILLAVLVGIVIVGGIKRIGSVADKIVPFMCVMYVISCIAILATHASAVPDAVATIFREAFALDSIYGGLLGVIIQGVRRAAFSNEAGVGSAAIAHSAARTKYPVREGMVALLEPFIDTIVVCFMTGSVIVVTGVYADPATAELGGVALTGAAFAEGLSDLAGYLLSAAVVLFAFSTMISWSYYGERCWSFLFGADQTQPYRLLFCGFVWVGCVASLGNVLDFSDLMILSMAFPNILGVIWLSPKIKKALDDYWARYKAGELKTYK